MLWCCGKKVAGSVPGSGDLSTRVPPCVCVDLLLEAPRILQHSSLTDNSKLSVGVSVSADGCLSGRGPAMNR